MLHRCLRLVSKLFDLSVYRYDCRRKVCRRINAREQGTSRNLSRRLIRLLFIVIRFTDFLRGSHWRMEPRLCLAIEAVWLSLLLNNKSRGLRTYFEGRLYELDT